MKKTAKKLVLTRETMRDLSQVEIREIAGGYSVSCLSCDVALGFCQRQPDTRTCYC